MTDTVKIIVSVLGVGVPLVLALISTAWFLRGRLERLEANLGGRLERLEANLGGRLERSEANLGGRLERSEANLGGRLDRVESRLGDLAAGVNGLNRQLASMMGLLPAAFSFLHRSKAITDEEYHESVGQFVGQMAQSTESLVDYLARTLNPFTPAEAQRFRELVDKARDGVFFTWEEVEEYDGLINKVQAEHPDDPRIWPLINLGAFLLGLYPGQRKGDSKT